MPDRYLGRTLGKYRVTRHLGTGAFAWVYEAVDLDLEIPVALKILRPEFAGLDTARARFRREAATAARLRHANIVTVRDVGHVDGAAFVAMDLHPLTLGHRLAHGGRLPETACVRLGIGIAAALAVAHARGVIHRDIKPDNILLDGQGEAIVADFGLARALAAEGSASATQQVQGTPHYFSPEQARAQQIDGRSDLYALGVTLYRAATGRLPFEGEDWYVVARQHIETPPPPPRTLIDELTPEFEAVVLRLMAKAPQDRFAHAMQVVDALAALPTAPARPPRAARLASETIDTRRLAPARVRRGPLLAGGAVLVALALWASYRLRPVSAGGRQPAVVTAPTAADTGVVHDPSRAASAVPGRDSATATHDVLFDSGRRPARDIGVRRPPVAVAKSARLDIATTDSAELYIDNRRVGRGSWTGEHAPTSRISIRAVLADAPISCTAAVRDTVLTQVKAGQRVMISLPVRTCVDVRFDIRPRDARVAIRPLDGGRGVETRADSVLTLSLPVGSYEVRTSAPRCITITDTLVAARAADGVPVSRRLRLLCS